MLLRTMIEVTAHIGILYIRVFIPAAQSLKDKRRVLKGLKDRVHNQFNVSLAELDREDKWQTATLGFAMISTDQPYIDRVFQNILSLIESVHAVEVCEHRIEFL